MLPHWNASPQQHVALCEAIAKLGISVLRISLPYHDRRMPPELTRADYAVSANIGRTIDATRQAVIDVRSCYDWLQQRGYTDLGIVGTSLGSCYAFLATSHDPRIRVNVFNHCSTYSPMWCGPAFRRATSAGASRTRSIWTACARLGTASARCTTWTVSRLAPADKRSFFLYATYDTTFLPEFSRQVLEHVRKRGVDHKLVVMPCGHYTLGESPFKFVVGYQICSFLKRNL